MYTLQHFKRMNASAQNNTTELIETVHIELAKKTSAPAKNRASYIKEAFEALPLVEGFPLTTEQLWEYFNKAAKSKDIKMRKLSEKNSEKKTAESGPKRLNGYNLFIKEFKEKGPEGVGVMTHKVAVWKALLQEEKDKWDERATEQNKSNGFEPKAKKLTHDQLIDAYWTELEKWAQEDPETRGEKPKAKKLTHDQLIDAYWDKLEKWAQEDPETRGKKPERPRNPKKLRRAKKADCEDVFALTERGQAVADILLRAPASLQAGGS